MGLKTGGREIAAAAGVPVVPAYDPASRDMLFPVLIKASAGGGGRGMRMVRRIRRAGGGAGIRAARSRARLSATAHF